jgi:hypothetical protein
MFSRFDRHFFDGKETFTVIGDGRIGGKAQGLALINETIGDTFSEGRFGPIDVNIPTLTVITTQHFDSFMERNNLYEIALSDASDERIAHHFQRAQLPADLAGDLMALIGKVHTPLAIRSSALLEDSMQTPFAGMYATKMIPNNQSDSGTRFHKLVEAIKFVYSSTYFSGVKNYFKAAGLDLRKEKMAVIIQEVVGLTHNKRYYPDISGVARSYNFYPQGYAEPEDGAVDLALGLGKTIVDGGRVWSYSPSYPAAFPPASSPGDLLKATQTEFWAVNMGSIPAYDPIKEEEYLIRLDLQDAEYDNTLRKIVSTYDGASDRITLGMGVPGPRLLSFAPLLDLEMLPLNDLISTLMDKCQQVVGGGVEIEFAMTIDYSGQKPPRFGILQVRPTALSHEEVELDSGDLDVEDAFVLSDNVLGNGVSDTIMDIVFVKPEGFDMKHSKKIALEIGGINKKMLALGKPYLLMGFGRWGSSDFWLGIPVNWGQISGAKAIVEVMLPGMSIDLSQGSHFFHNLSNLGIYYFSLKQSGEQNVLDWEWLAQQEKMDEGEFVRHVRVASPLVVKVDGRKKMGVIKK